MHPIDGENPDDPGIRLLAAAVHSVPGSRLLLVHTGPIPGVRPGAVRLVLDAREAPEAGERCVADQLTLGDTPERCAALSGDFSDALVWPRAHLGKDFSERCLTIAALSLPPGGRVWLSVRKRKGGASLARFVERLVGNVRVAKRDRGYHLHVAERAEELDLELAREVLSRSYTIVDPRLGDLELLGVPGVFSRKHLDRGTAALLDHIARPDVIPSTPARVIDLGAGLGPLSLWAAQRSPTTRVLAVESNTLAASLVRHNATRAGVDRRVIVHNGDGLPPLDQASDAVREFHGHADLALVNPPTHAPADQLAALVAPLALWLRPGAPAFFVVNRSASLLRGLSRTERELADLEERAVEGFTVVRARWR
ncbi:MAG: methyltransferase [Myxococcales bacterium]|nr:methyltransferase [Myxococcales bacterium]